MKRILPILTVVGISLIAVIVNIRFVHQPPKPHETPNFARVTIAFLCNSTTPPSARKQVDGIPGFMPAQCIDVVNDVNFHPLKVNILHNVRADLWSVRLKLSKGDAAALAQLTAHSDGQATALLVSGELLLTSFINAPFYGDDFDISANDEEQADKTASAFLWPRQARK